MNLPDTTMFSTVDWVLLAILALSIFSGARLGLVKQVLSFAGLFISLFLAHRWAPATAEWLNKTFDASAHIRGFLLPLFGDYRLEPTVLAVLSYLVVWCICSAAIFAFGRFLESVANLPILSSFNKLGGALLGALKGGIIVFIIASLMSFLPVDKLVGSWAQGSYLATQVRVASPLLYGHLRDLIERIWLLPTFHY